MKYLILQFVCVLALVAAPATGCGSSDDGDGATGGTAGVAGTGGTAGASGTGGAAGMGGTAGAGGVATITTGLWTGEGDDGPGAPWTICFSVNEAGDALTADPVECQAFAIQVSLAGCPNSVWWRPDIPIVEGSFSLIEPGLYQVQGTFDGNTASGEATFTTDGVDCTGQWRASPSM